MSDAANADMASVDSEQKQSAAGAAGERLHPLTLVLAMIAFLPRFAFAAIPIYFAMRDEMSRAIGFIGGFIIVSTLVALFFTWLKWSRFTFSLGNSEIRITSGVLSRNSRSIPYERVQDVNIEQNLLARIFGLATVKLETGSGGGSDGELDSVLLERADAIRDTIRERKAGQVAAEMPASAAGEAEPDSAPTAVAEADGELIYAMDGKRLFILGIFSFSLAIFAFLFAIFQNLDFLLPDDIIDADTIVGTVTGENVDSRVGAIQSQVGAIGRAGQICVTLAGLAGLLLVGFLTGMVQVVLREYGFRLEDNGKAFRRRRGLLTLTDVAMPLHRVQTAVTITGPIRRRFGWHALKFQSLASDGDEGSDHVVAPLATRDEVQSVAARAGIDIQLERNALHPVSPTYWLVPFIPLALLLTLGLSVLVFVSARPILGALLLLPLLVLLFGWLRWRHHLYASTDNYLHVHHGFWRQHHTVLPLKKIQSVDVSQNIVQRAFGKASITIGVAGGSTVFPLTVHAIDDDSAYALRGYLLERMTL
ncbi:PH domain-containing protein [Alterisphingorhabdus coralli]|uniref:PH domain-containing protein n=1 Tax=Alterisphingorhabdus coralli TaxID=3071408 RepID=A0AA97F652_9SPHN|nr:PH domain-containing protein [Parasphingorhabdus sp. SCSIO 66989]WOE74936.1 PH domain-containing protein [Parasphingorhabdus sp. SCSIO 66989]